MSTLSNAWAVLRKGGPVAFMRVALDRIGGPDTSSLVEYSSARDVDFTSGHPAVLNPKPLPPGPLTVAWIMSPPGEGSGGHQNIFRFIRYLEGAGHTARVYLHDMEEAYTAAAVASRLSSSSYAQVNAKVENLTAAGVADDVDVIIATGWETAYPSYLDASPARRLYFVQDYEPYFYTIGTEAVLAENTYRFGFSAITAGAWLADKLSREFGMTTRSYQFGADRATYNLINEKPRKEIFFYARPGTPRRGFELGIMALDLFARERPDYTINLAGSDVHRYRIPFDYQNLKSLPVGALNELYNRCAAGLVLSLTNMSLMPLELIAAGVIPVVNDAPNNTMVSSNPYIEYAPPTPRALADRLIAVVDRSDLLEHSRTAAASLGAAGWDESGREFVQAFESVLRG
jgi:glycosyltransferase involved in cell wall biosynthesis